MELPNHRGLEEKLGKLHSCPGPGLATTPPQYALRPSPLISCGGSSDREHKKDGKEGIQKDKGRETRGSRDGGIQTGDLRDNCCWVGSSKSKGLVTRESCGSSKDPQNVAQD